MYIVLAQLLVEGKHQRRHKKKKERNENKMLLLEPLSPFPRICHLLFTLTF